MSFSTHGTASLWWVACVCALVFATACEDATPTTDEPVGEDAVPEVHDVSADTTSPDVETDVPLPDQAPSVPCNACHGSVDGPAPPADLDGSWSTVSPGVGAHQSHSVAEPTWYRAIRCPDCHIEPTHLNDLGHMDSERPAEVVWGSLAGSNGAAPEYDGVTCQNVYCHGSTLSGGTNVAPNWTTVDGTQGACGTCHGLPPGEPHVQAETCFACHPNVDAASKFVDPSTHINGVVDLDLRGLTCSSCHGSGNDSAPPNDLEGGADETRPGVGSHQSHLQASSWRATIRCNDCHISPTETWAPGHIDTLPPAEVTFLGSVAQADGAEPSYDGTRCVDVYCHGETLQPGGLRTRPIWALVDGTQSECGTCHAIPPLGEHPNAVECHTCHDNMDAAMGFTKPETHIDGVVDLGGLACTGCHGLAGIGSAPPFDLTGGMVTTRRGVGAHQSHLRPASWRATIACDQCHVVPSTVAQTGHLEPTPEVPPGPAELSFGHLAVADGADPAFNGTTCTGVYCHGTTLEPGGSVTEPVWALVDGSQSTCGTCHRLPPGGAHPVLDDCEQCHAIIDANGVIIDPARHINGIIDLVDLNCMSCHGSENSAPPMDTAGATSTTLPSVGAHQSHLGESDWRADVDCQECHRVPETLTELGHTDSGLPAEVIWGPRALADSATPGWNGTRCTGVYCHGATLMPGGIETSPAWTTVDGTQAACGTCHGMPPGGSHPATTQCDWCHGEVMAPGGVFRDRTLHIDGVVQAVRLHATGWEQPDHHGTTVNDSGFASCQTCHGLRLDGGTTGFSCQDGCHTPGWVEDCTMCHGGQLNDSGAPPYANSGQTARTDITVGAHTEHVAGAEQPCSKCHLEPTSIFSLGHIDGDGVAEVTFDQVNANGTYDHRTGECADLWCHGNGSSSLGGAEWDVDETLGCTSCHGTSSPRLSGRHWHAAYGCYRCHVDVADSGNNIIDVSLHANGEVNLPSWWDPNANGGRGRCNSGFGCHGPRNWY